MSSLLIATVPSALDDGEDWQLINKSTANKVKTANKLSNTVPLTATTNTNTSNTSNTKRRPAFYNTREGTAIISATKAKSKSTASTVDSVYPIKFQSYPFQQEYRLDRFASTPSQPRFTMKKPIVKNTNNSNSTINLVESLNSYNTRAINPSSGFFLAKHTNTLLST